MNPEQEFHGPNLAYVQGLRERYQTDPESLDPATRAYFQRMELEEAGPGSQPVADLKSVIAAANLAQAIRSQGYLAADLNPLFDEPGDPSLTLDYHHLREEDLARTSGGIGKFPGCERGKCAGGDYRFTECILRNDRL